VIAVVAMGTRDGSSGGTPAPQPSPPTTTDNRAPASTRTAIVVTPSERTPGVVRSGPGMTFSYLTVVKFGLQVTVTGPVTAGFPYRPATEPPGGCTRIFCGSSDVS
jgi:hypothetical protein